MLYSNGLIPESVLVEIGSGWDSNGFWRWMATPATVARFRFAQRYSLEHFGREIGIRTGWNVYRPLASQEQARENACASGNCAGAAVPVPAVRRRPRNGRDCLAIDVDPNGLEWWQVDEAMAAAGFAVGLITEAMSGIPGGEPWHYIDFYAFGPVPAFDGSTPFPKEDDMSAAAEAQIDALYKSQFFGAKWNDKDGGHWDVKYGNFQVDLYTQTLVASLQGQVAALIAAVGKIAGGEALDVDELKAAAKAGAKEALAEFHVEFPTADQIADAVNDDAAERLKG